MSQHFLTAICMDRKVDVMMGWDRPLQQFFLVVTLVDPEEGEDEFIYNNTMQCT